MVAPAIASHEQNVCGCNAQMYYSTPGEDPATSMAWDEGTHSGDIRGSWGYVMAAGCLHPSGETYSVLVDAPIAPVPERARQFKKSIPKGRPGALSPHRAGPDRRPSHQPHRGTPALESCPVLSDSILPSRLDTLFRCPPKR